MRTDQLSPVPTGSHQNELRLQLWRRPKIVTQCPANVLVYVRLTLLREDKAKCVRAAFRLFRNARVCVEDIRCKKYSWPTYSDTIQVPAV